ncbi:hypothetical protein [Cupriavidus sp. USMAHM13]|uniref:hypothetical protein n=1 Tax=Cupriavidus sp. USMAHM13 TaxID=1389192 RepID=UPI0012EA9A8C|nr:hypothetical protein [Cupriavidus sp. USMAHM13]
MKKALALAQLATAATASMACTPGNLDFEPKFEPGRSQLSGTEVLRLAEWRADQRERYPNGGEIHAEVQANTEAGVPHKLAEARLATFLGLLRDLGITEEEMEKPGIVDRAIDSAHLRSAELRPKVLEYLNTAGISIHPRCPHPCCLGSEPIERR